MELRYQFVIFIGIVVVICLMFARLLNDKNYKGGKKIANLYGLEDDAYFRRKKAIYNILKWMITATYLITIILSFFLLAMPYTTQKESREEYKRDIMLCMDISSSVDELNERLVGELKDTVNELKGERFGIVIFNTSGVLLSPLTDDYEYVTDMLDQIGSALKSRNDLDGDNWLYNSQFLMAGTLVGNEERGSSLIGDGLATAVYDFPDIDEDRKRIIIFSTDNELQGTPIYSLSEAADVCVKHNAVVYGIGTKIMADKDEREMKNAVEKTGGKYYREEETGTVKSIVNDINKQAKNLVKGKSFIREIPWVKIPVIMLCISFMLQLALARFMKL